MEIPSGSLTVGARWNNLRTSVRKRRRVKVADGNRPWRKFDRGVVRRFFGAWIALTVAGVIVVAGGGTALWLLDLAARAANPPAEFIDDTPPFLYFMMAGAGVLGSILLGWPFALLRGRIVGPRFPFLRRGYLVVMALALIPVVPFLFYGQWQVLFFAVVVQIPMLAMTAIYLMFSFVFGLFGPDSLPIWRWPAWRWRMGTLDGRTEN